MGIDSHLKKRVVSDRRPQWQRLHPAKCRGRNKKTNAMRNKSQGLACNVIICTRYDVTAGICSRGVYVQGRSLTHINTYLYMDLQIQVNFQGLTLYAFIVTVLLLKLQWDFS